MPPLGDATSGLHGLANGAQFRVQAPFSLVWESLCNKQTAKLYVRHQRQEAASISLLPPTPDSDWPAWQVEGLRPVRTILA